MIGVVITARRIEPRGRASPDLMARVLGSTIGVPAVGMSEAEQNLNPLWQFGVA